MKAKKKTSGRYIAETTDEPIIEDELSRTRKYREERRKRIERMKELGVPESLIKFEEMLATLTHSEYLLFCKEQELQDEEEKREYRKNNPPKEEVASLIWTTFDRWFEKYKDNIEVLNNELDTGHYFYEPWYWGKVPPGAEQEFYQRILNEDDWWSGNYQPVFEICRQKIRDRLKELDSVSGE